MRDYKITYNNGLVTVVSAPTADKARDVLRKIIPHIRISNTTIVKTIK